MSKVTKADRIRTLYAAGKTVREIMEIVGCSDSYVRVAARQRAGGKICKADRTYDDHRRHYPLGDREAARAAKNEAYRLALDAGLSRDKANSIGGGAYGCVMRATGRQRRKACEVAA